MSYPKVAFVAEPKVGARVLFDFNDAGLGTELTTQGAYVGAEGWSLGAPSLDGPIDAVGLTWGERTLTLPFHVRMSRRAGANVLTRMVREAIRSSAYLLWQLDRDRDPVWFSTRAADVGDLDFFEVVLDDTLESAWATILEIPADAWAIGEPITQTFDPVWNDPAPFYNGCTVLMDPMVGDAPAPLEVSITPVAGDVWAGRHTLVAAVSSTVERDAKPIYIDSAAFTAHPSAPAPLPARSNNTTWAGDYYREVPIGDAVGPSQAMRPWLRATGGVDAVPVGRYAVYLQCGVNGQVTAYDVATEQYPRDSGRVGPSDSGTGLRTWIPIGTMGFPQGVDTSALSYGERITSYVIDLWARVVSGSTASGARFGAMLLIPIEGPGVAPTTAVTFTAGPGVLLNGEAGRRVVVDGQANTVLGRTADGTLARFSPGWPRGVYPVGHPGYNNRITMLTQTLGVNASATGASDDSRKVHRIDVTYRPRYMWMPSTEDEWDRAKESGQALNEYLDGPP